MIELFSGRDLAANYKANAHLLQVGSIITNQYGEHYVLCHFMQDTTNAILLRKTEREILGGQYDLRHINYESRNSRIGKYFDPQNILPPIPAHLCEQLLKEWNDQMEAKRIADAEERTERQQFIEKGKYYMLQLDPKQSYTHAIVYAEYQNDSDIMTDYFSEKCIGLTVLGFSSNDRHDVREYRKFCVNHAQSYYLGDNFYAGMVTHTHKQDTSRGRKYLAAGFGYGENRVEKVSIDAVYETIGRGRLSLEKVKGYKVTADVAGEKHISNVGAEDEESAKKAMYELLKRFAHRQRYIDELEVTYTCVEIPATAEKSSAPASTWNGDKSTLEILNYNEKCCILVGTNKEMAESIKALGCWTKFNPFLKHPDTGVRIAGWIFGKKDRETFERFIKG